MSIICFTLSSSFKIQFVVVAAKVFIDCGAGAKIFNVVIHPGGHVHKLFWDLKACLGCHNLPLWILLAEMLGSHTILVSPNAGVRSVTSTKLFMISLSFRESDAGMYRVLEKDCQKINVVILNAFNRLNSSMIYINCRNYRHFEFEICLK